MLKTQVTRAIAKLFYPVVGVAFCCGSLNACSFSSDASARTRRDQSANKPVSADRPVALIGSEPIPLRDIDAIVGQEVYTQRYTALREIVVERLVGEEARRRGVSAEELKRVEVEDKVPQPSREDLVKFFEATKKNDPAIRDKSFESVESGISSIRRSQLLRDRWLAFANELYDRAHVRIDLAALGRPQLVMRPRGPHRGAAAPKFVLAEYADFKSPFCKRADEAVKQVLKEYGEVLAVYFRQKPAEGDADSMRAAEAALCAADQNKYWEYREELFDNQQDLGTAALSNYADHAHLDVVAFGKCLESGSKRSLIAEDMQEAQSNRLEGSPVFSLNGTRLSGAHEFADFKELIDTELKWSR